MQLLFKLFLWIGSLIFYAQCDDTREKVIIPVVTILESPYTMLRDDHTTLTGNERYEGYMVDLIEEIAKRLDFKYEMHIVEDGRYGALRDNNEWDGLIGEIVNRQATIGAAAITMTSKRESAVDFTVPFMHLGITTLYKRSGETLPVKTLEELVASKTTTFGCVRGGSTHKFFADSEYPIYKRIFERMEPSTFVSTVSEGVERVKKKDYAFFMESSTLEYFVERDCDLQQVGGLLNSRGFGLAVPKGSPIRTKLSQVILDLEETGALAALKLKWWKRRDGEQCVHQK